MKTTPKYVGLTEHTFSNVIFRLQTIHSNIYNKRCYAYLFIAEVNIYVLVFYKKAGQYFYNVKVRFVSTIQDLRLSALAY